MSWIVTYRHGFCPHLSVMTPVESGQQQVALYPMESPQSWSGIQRIRGFIR
jgi:hypothetical protein